MVPQRNGLSLQSQLRPLSALVFHLLLTHSVRGQSQLMGPSQPIVATVGDDIILPCHLEPAVDVAAMTLEWTRTDLNPIFVLVWRAGQDYLHSKDPSYKGRTSLFSDELKRGNISLKLSDVRPSDAGRYRCFIPTFNIDSFVELVVGAASSPVISLAGIDRDKGGVVLQCESAGWYPEPEVLWLDGEGKLLSAGPTETVRGPDDLYTVSSRVTVEKRHSNSFTCRVQQRNINQTTETHISMSDDFFKVQSSSAVPIITGLAVSLTVCIMFIALLLIFLWKWRQDIIKTKRSHCDETETGKKKNSSKTNKTEDQSVPVEEREHLMTTETVEMKIEKQRCQQQLLEEQQRREEAEKGVQTLKEEMETKRKEVETKQYELQQLHEEKQRNEDELQTLKEELEKKNKELETIPETHCFLSRRHHRFRHQRWEVETLKIKLETKQTEVDSKIKKIDEKQAEVQQLQNQIQMVSNLQILMETLSKNMELERSRVTPAHSSSSAVSGQSKWPIVSRQKFQEEQQRREDAENKVKNLMKELQTQIKEWKKNYELMENKNKEISHIKRHVCMHA
uniref:butyrophilin subfamily 2 member A1-like n=1 Tax=Epinephelus lanceolatus TaxID=310571 RepID=UPI0014453D84|nr:butyrophilin subfamily 2 member A1-like [Epinephelus lanceolatus]